MANIYNSELTKEIIDGAKIQTSHDLVPSQIAEKVVPTMEVNPKLLRSVDVGVTNTKSTTGGGTVYTTPTNKDFYLTSASFCMVKDATCDVSNSGIACFFMQGGEAKYLFTIPALTLTAQQGYLTQTFNPPIKLDRGSNIGHSTTYANGTMVRTMTVLGYLVD